MRGGRDENDRRDEGRILVRRGLELELELELVVAIGGSEPASTQQAECVRRHCVDEVKLMETQHGPWMSVWMRSMRGG